MMDDQPLRTPIEIPPLEGVFTEPFSPRKLWRLLSFFGPAAVAASVSIGAGETLIVVVTGAWAQYQLLWLVLLACLVKGVFVTYLLGRYTALTGEYLGHRLVRLPGPRGWFLLLLIAIEILAMGPLCTVVCRPCGNLLAHLLDPYLWGERVAAGRLAADAAQWWETAFAAGFVILALGLSLALSYHKLEKQNLIICGILVAGTVIVTLLVHPDYAAAIRGTLWPVFPLTQWRGPDGTPHPPNAGEYGLPYFLLMVTVFGYVGNTVFGYLVYSNWVGLHGWGLTSHPQIGAIRRKLVNSGSFDYLPTQPDQVARARRRLTPLRFDIALGALVLFIVTASFMMAGAQVMFPRIDADPLHRIPDWSEVLTEQRYVWQQLSRLLVPVYFVCVLAALWGTLNTLPEIWARVIKEFLAAIWPQVEHWRYRRFQLLIVAVSLAPCLVCLFLGWNVELLAAITATLTTNLGVALACGMGVYLNMTLPKPYRPRLPLLVGGLAATIVLVISALGGVIGLVQRMTG